MVLLYKILNYGIKLIFVVKALVAVKKAKLSIVVS